MRRFILLIICIIPGYYLAAQSVNVSKFQYISPSPGSVLVTPETNIIIKPGEVLATFDLNDPSLISVTGHLGIDSYPGKLYLTSDSKTIVFIPDNPFTPGEEITVNLANKLKTLHNVPIGELQFSFKITPDKGCLKTLQPAAPLYPMNWNFSASKVSADSSLIYPVDFPEISVTKYSAPENGNYFIALKRLTTRYLAILDNNGIPVFYESKTGDVYDFKLQKNGMLTYYSLKNRKFYGMDSKYAIVDSFFTGNGYWADFHDLQVMPDNHAFLIAYDTEPVRMDTVVSNNDTTACVQGCILQEIDTSKNVIWQWRSWDHFDITDTQFDLTQRNIQSCHTNSIDIIDDSTAVISSRHMDEITKINRITGDIIWRLGGKRNQFTIDSNAPDFHMQHDARYLGNNKFSLYDNGLQSNNENSSSRGLIYNLDQVKHTGSKVIEIRHNPELFAPNMGNMQVTKKGNIIIEWGNIGADSLGYRNIISEYDSAGNIVSEIRLNDGSYLYSYRAFKFPWKNNLLTSDTDTLKFPGDTTLSFAVKNNGTETLQMEGVYIDSANFQLADPTSFPVQLSPGQTDTLKIKFTRPDTSRIYGGTAYVVTRRNDQMIALPVTLTGNSTITSIENGPSTLPLSYRLSQNYPNPFNPSTNIEYSIPSEEFVTLKIYDILGRLVKTLVNGVKPAGNHRIIFNSSNFSNGVYFYKLNAGNFSSVKKMILLK